ncbi:MAG: 6-hydroxymethylpterin diphosphokinase MptE-like protein [Planctomycetota bacterium]
MADIVIEQPEAIEQPELLHKNLQALQRFPRVVKALNGVEPYPCDDVVLARNGAPVPRVRDEQGQSRLFHSKYDPQREALQQLPEETDDELDLLASYIFLGAGFGYAPLAALPRLTESNLLIWVEPDVRLFRTALGYVDLTAIFARKHCIVQVGADEGQLFRVLHDYTTVLFSSKISLVVHPVSQQLTPQLFDHLCKSINDFTREGAVRLRTAFYLSRISLQNQVENLGHYLQSPGLLPLRGALTGKPAIVVSAGPSLRKNIEVLRDAVGKVTIIAVSTALRRLLAAGVQPDFTVLIDYHRVSRRYFEGIPAVDAPAMICETKATADGVGAYPGVHLFGNDLFFNTLLEGVIGDKASLPSSSTVAHAAFHAAALLGADPVIFIGQDLAYPGGLVHVPGTAVQTQVYPQTHRFYSMEMQELEYYLTQRKSFQRVPGIPDGEVPTDDVFFTYLKEFEMYFEDFAGEVIDATEGGARMRHTTVMPLREVLARFGDQERPDFQQLIRDAKSRLPVAELRDRVHELIVKRRRELRDLREMYRKILKLLGRVIRTNEKGEEADKLVLRVQELHQKTQRFPTVYMILSQLAQSDLWVRRRADRLLDVRGDAGIDRQLAQAQRDRDYVKGIYHASEFLARCLESAEAAVAEVVAETPLEA